MTYTVDDPMPFGKHKGVPIRGLPIDYLEWLVNNIEWLVNNIEDSRNGLYEAICQAYNDQKKQAVAR